MAQIVLTIPNAQMARVITALCTAGGYTGDLADQAAAIAFAQAYIADQTRATVLRVERAQAASQAMSTVVVNPTSIA